MPLMRKTALILLLSVVFLSTTGAAIIDKETKNSVISLDQKLTALAQTEQRHYSEIMRLLKEQSDPAAKIHPIAAGAAPAAAASPAPVSTPPGPNDVRAMIKNTESTSVLALLISGITLFLIIAMFVVFRRSEEKIQKMVWKSEMETLREDISRGRPHLKVQTNAEGIALLNIGETPADEIRLYLGPTASTMRQKMKVPPTIQTGEKVEIPLQSSRSDDLLYATLEYKNPHTGRLYKEQFSLKVDRMTGELIPIQQAS